MAGLEIWGGVECTVNRVGDVWRDQLRLSGHHERLDDLDRIAALGIRTLRFPVLWERFRGDWSWTDARLDRLRTLGITPIVTLCHHGSGPSGTSLLEPSFATGLAAFARQVAGRYPWVERYTPVNEPLTTARFSGLYGHWYPHLREERAFVRMLMNELSATALAMRAIREVTPEAQLIQTEDFAAIHAMPAVREQAEHENERRWLTFDVLCGRFENAALRDYLRLGHVAQQELDLFPCAPALVGLNYYLTSERLLDDRLARYPTWLHGGNGRQRYADVEAVRTVSEGVVGHLGALRLAWERYRLPLAFTEAHLGCTREEQLRWLDEAWRALEQGRAEGIDARALTAWALFGTYDWNSLVTRDGGHYEPGAFDVRGARPRETALAAFVRAHCPGSGPGARPALASAPGTSHPVLDVPGWWRRPQRFSFPPVETGTTPIEPGHRRPHAPRRLLITGAGGLLGRAFVAHCEGRGMPHVATTRAQLELSDGAALHRVLDEVRPWAVINAAGYEGDSADRCARDNTSAAATLAATCAAAGLPLVCFSSDSVFDGSAGRAYVEEDRPGPLCDYGRSKLAAERRVLAVHPQALLIRTSALFGGLTDFVARALAALARGAAPVLNAGHVLAPTFVPDLADAALDLLIDGASGLWHLTSPGAMSRAELVQHAAEHVGVRFRAGREPLDRSTVLSSAKAGVMPALNDALSRYLESLRAPARAA
jgi:dTDP-4-dehydrorhamnose reductase